MDLNSLMFIHFRLLWLLKLHKSQHSGFFNKVAANCTTFQIRIFFKQAGFENHWSAQKIYIWMYPRFLHAQIRLQQEVRLGGHHIPGPHGWHNSARHTAATNRSRLRSSRLWASPGLQYQSHQLVPSCDYLHSWCCLAPVWDPAPYKH